MDALSHLAVIWICVYLAVIAANKTRLTPVLYFLALGSLLANIGIIPEHPDVFIRGFADIGIILIMFALGFEENSANFIQGIKRSWGIALFGAIAPFIAAYLIADHYWQSTPVSLMCALAMTATAVSLTMVSLKEEGLQGSPAATGIMTSAVLDDIASLALVAILVPVAAGSIEMSLASISWILAKAIGFFVIVYIAGIIVFPHDLSGWMSRIPFLGALGIRHLLSFGEGKHTTLTVLLLALLVGLLAHQFGFHPAVGAYMAGLILKEEYFQFHRYPDIDYYADTKQVVDNVAFSWIGPVFFVVLGAQIVFEPAMVIAVLPQTIFLTIGLLVAQVASASLAARYTGGFNQAESIMIGFGMLGRAELAFVVIDIAYVQNNILPAEAFFTLMFTAFFLNIAVPISISLWKPYFLAAQKQTNN